VRKQFKKKTISIIIMTEKYNLGPLCVDSIECINLDHRQDRKKAMKKQAKKKQFPVHFTKRKGNPKDPERDRFEAHINIIKQAAEKWSVHLKSHSLQENENVETHDKITKAILILEDDAYVLSKSLLLPSSPPSDWEMLYLGGHVHKLLKDDDLVWKRACCTMTHAYIVRSTLFQTIIDKSKDAIGKISLEKFYCQGIHEDYPTYMMAPEYVIQRNGYSDVKKRFLTYGQQSTNIIFEGNEESMLTKKIESAPLEGMSESEGGGFKLSFPHLPTLTDEDYPLITLITATTNRREFFDFCVRNFYLLQYPSDKIRWVIADDSDYDKKVADLVPGDDPRIKYVNCKIDAGQHLPLTKKLNLCVAYAEKDTEYFLVFSDDCYYPPHSAMSRVKTLLEYKAAFSESNTDEENTNCVGCVGSTEFGIFDFELNKSYVSHYDDLRGNPTILTIPSLGFSKQYYDNRKFDETALAFPSFPFCVGRFEEVVQIPYEFIYIQLHSDKLKSDVKYTKGNNDKQTHKTEKSQKTKAIEQKEDGNKFSFYDTWDHDTREFVLLIKETV
jgi:hypothetical protein